MTALELVSCVVLGVASGFTLAGLARWRSVGFGRALVLGGLGGVIGGLVGAGTGPVWGALRYHPAAAAFAVIGGCSAVVMVRLLVGHPTLRAGRPFRDP